MSVPLRRPLPLALTALFVAALLATWLAPRALEASERTAESALQNALSDAVARAPSALYGVYVQNLRTGAVVYSHNARQSFLPASNLKLVTSALALRTLGPDHRFETGLYFEGQVEGATLRGDLVIRGSGDPTFGSILSGSDPLAAWARELRALGVERVEGRIVGDDRAMAHEPYAPGWDVDNIATAEWAAPASGLSYGDNVVTVEIAGTRVGQPASVTASPAGYVTLRSALRTRGGAGFGPLRIERTIGTNDIVVEGAISAAYRGSARIPVHDPTLFTVATFAERLRRAGIAVEAELVRARDLPTPPTYTTDPLFVHHSPPLRDILEVINVRSNNLYAEQVFRASAPGGSLRSAALRATALMQAAGAPTAGFSMRDGSGLSRKNLVTPEGLGRLLAYMYASEDREAYLSTFPRGGQPGSTLRFRLGGVPVWAKTGALEHVRGLSGYVLGPDGTPYAFVIFANNFTAPSAAITAMQNEIVLALARGGAPPRRR